MLKFTRFQPHLRIRERSDFHRTFRKSRRLISPFYTLYYCDNHLEHPRIGIITSKKNLRRAVWRNQVKRVARETFRQNQARLKFVDIVLVAQKRAKEASKAELRECLEKLFKKLMA